LEVFFQVWEESAEAQEGATTAVRSAGEKKIWTIGFYVQEELRRSAQKEEIDSRWISFRNPVSRWIGRRCSEFSLWRSAGEEAVDLGSDPSADQILEQIDQPSDWTGGAARGLAIGISVIGKSGFSRTRKSRHFKSRNTGRSGPSVSGDTWQRSSPSVLWCIGKSAFPWTRDREFPC
jgi:hypothetical protein